MARLPDQVVRQREEIAWEMRQKGKTELQIAKHLGVTKQAVSHILIRIEKRTFRDMAKAIARTKARQTAQLEWVASQASEAWQRSLENAETEKTIESADDGDGDPTVRREKTVKGQSGNPAHLAQFREALADIRAIWGLDAPQKIAATDDQGNSSPLLEAIRAGIAIVLNRTRDPDRGADPVPGDRT